MKANVVLPGQNLSAILVNWDPHIHCISREKVTESCTRVAERMLWAFGYLGTCVAGRKECGIGRLASSEAGENVVLGVWAVVWLGEENVVLGIWAACRRIAFSIHLTWWRGEAR